MRAAAIAAALLLLPACQREQPPDATYRALVRAMADRDEATAWDLLSATTRSRLEAKARSAAAAAPGVVAPRAASLLSGDAPLAVLPPTSIAVVQAGADRAVLRVEAPGSPARDVVLLRERGAWRVDLPAE